jgi:hypothetical protein
MVIVVVMLLDTHRKRLHKRTCSMLRGACGMCKPRNIQSKLVDLQAVHAYVVWRRDLAAVAEIQAIQPLQETASTTRLQGPWVN